MNEKYIKINGNSEYILDFKKTTKNVSDFINIYSQLVSYIKSLKASLALRNVRFIDDYFLN